jgi:hypothetical protein
MTVKAFQKALRESRSVTGLPWGGPTPAAFLNSMQFHFVMAYMPNLKLYKPKYESKSKHSSRGTCRQETR